MSIQTAAAASTETAADDAIGRTPWRVLATSRMGRRSHCSRAQSVAGTEWMLTQNESAVACVASKRRDDLLRLFACEDQ